MIDICVGATSLSAQDPSEKDVTSPAKQAMGGSYLSFMALNRGSASGSTTEPPLPPSPTATTVTAKPESRRQGSISTAGPEDRPPSTSGSGSGTSTPALPPGPATKPPAPVRRPSPRVFFAHFVDHLERFVGFLEAVAVRRWGQSVDGTGIPSDFTPEPVLDEAADRADQVAVWNTLLELYLTLPAASPGSRVPNGDAVSAAAVAFREKALRVLQTPSLPYDPTHALILCSTRSFTPGLVLLWERRGMHEDVLRFWMDRHAADDDKASVEVVRYLRAYGTNRPALYPLVLRFLTSSGALLSKHRKEVEDVLEHIEAEKIMSPVAVVQVLSRNGVASVGLVKQWLMTRIKEAREEIRTVSPPFYCPSTALTPSYRMNS
jgi:vacuolar protein sorting-associated protein 11